MEANMLDIKFAALLVDRVLDSIALKMGKPSNGEVTGMDPYAMF